MNYELGAAFWIVTAAVFAVAVLATWRFGRRGAQAVGLIGLAATIGAAAAMLG